MSAGGLFVPAPTCHSAPWALVKRGGAVPMQRPRTRLVYLTGTYSPRGVSVATAFKGFLVRLDREGRVVQDSRRPVLIGMGDLVERWSSVPSVERVVRARRRLPRAGVGL